MTGGNQLRQSRRREQAEEDVILRQLTEQVAEVLPDLEHLLAVATALDLATARARYSLWLEGNPPHFVDPQEPITLRQLRHPLLLWQASHEQGPAVVPIDVFVKPETQVVAITGPNTGGKTVTLKTLGLAALMAKAGLFIPPENRLNCLGLRKFWLILEMNSRLNRVYPPFLAISAELFGLLKRLSLKMLNTLGKGPLHLWCYSMKLGRGQTR